MPFKNARPRMIMRRTNRLTALNIAKWPDQIIIISDGAGYSNDRTLLSAASKIDLLPHFSGFVMNSGGSAWAPAIAAMFGNIASDTDDLFDKAEWLLLEVE